MTENRRIALNVVATYGRSLYALVIGLFCGRWTLMALGHSDYGLLGVVGGMIGFVTFFNSLMAGAVSRFYAFSVGESQKEGNAEAGLEMCRKWFSIAVVIHTVLPVVLVAIGYPFGEWAVRNYLAIPSGRVEACIWIWRFTCVSCFVGMVGVPFRAMYTAKQEIAELTIYEFATTTLNVLFLGYMITHPGDWLVRYSLWSCLMIVLPQLMICVRSVLVYRECRLGVRYLAELDGYRSMAGYAFSRFLVLFSQTLAFNGAGILVNKCLGSAKNASMTVSGSLSRHCQALSCAILGAFSPAITNAAGAGRLDQMRKLAFETCVLSTVAVGMFAVPMILEADEILRLWLVNPPEGAAGLCVCWLCYEILLKITEGHWIAIFAIGRIALYNAVEAIYWLLVLPLAYLFIRGGLDVVGAGLAFVCISIGVVATKLYFGRMVAGLSIRLWVRRIFLPLVLAFGVTFAVGSVSVGFLPASFVRVVVTTGAVEIVFLPLVWLFVLKDSERAYVKERIGSKLGRFLNGGRDR